MRSFVKSFFQRFPVPLSTKCQTANENGTYIVYLDVYFFGIKVAHLYKR